MKNWNKLLRTVFALCVVFNVAYAIQEDKISSVMREKIDSATQILQNDKLDKNAKQKKLFEIFDLVFDYQLMSKLSLGKQWNSLNAQQQQKFIQTFEQKLKVSYTDKLHLYNNQKIVLKDLEKPKSSRIELVMQIVGEKETLDIIYKFYKSKKNGWLIYDVNILGISIIQTYRNQFVGILQKNSFEELIERLNKIEDVAK